MQKNYIAAIIIYNMGSNTDLTEILTSRLPFIDMQNGLSLVEIAQFDIKPSGKTKIGYVCGYCKVDEGPAIVFGNSLENGGVYNSGSRTTIDALPIRNIGAYTVLLPKEES